MIVTRADFFCSYCKQVPWAESWPLVSVKRWARHCYFQFAHLILAACGGAGAGPVRTGRQTGMKLSLSVSTLQEVLLAAFVSGVLGMTLCIKVPQCIREEGLDTLPLNGQGHGHLIKSSQLCSLLINVKNYPVQANWKHKFHLRWIITYIHTVLWDYMDCIHLI